MLEFFPDYFGKPISDYSGDSSFGVNVIGDEYSYNPKVKVSDDNFIKSGITLQFDSQQMATFRAWHYHKLNNGNAWFWMNIPELDDVRRCRIVDGLFSAELVEHKYFEVSFSVEYRKKKVPYYFKSDDTDIVSGLASVEGSLVTPLQPDDIDTITAAGVTFSGNLSAIIKPDDTETISASSVTLDGSLVSPIEPDDTETISATVTISGTLTL